MARLRQKSELLTGYLEYLLDQNFDGRVQCITPREPRVRGCQLSLVIPASGKRTFQQLADRGVICDWREPDAIRVAPVPLYSTFMDVNMFVTMLKEILQ
jgi:kynureninase